MSDLVRFSDLFSMFDELAPRWSPARTFHAALDVAEGDGEYIVRMDVPGVKADDLNIEMRDNILTVRGHREYSYEDGVEGLSRLERGYGTFQRSIALPRGVGEVDADLADGVLTLRIEKPVEAKPRRIELGGSAKTIEATTSEGG